MNTNEAVLTYSSSHPPDHAQYSLIGDFPYEIRWRSPPMILEQRNRIDDHFQVLLRGNARFSLPSTHSFSLSPLILPSVWGAAPLIPLLVIPQSAS